MNVVLLLNCEAANEKAGLRQAHNVLRQLCDNGNKVTIFGECNCFGYFSFSYFELLYSLNCTDFFYALQMEKLDFSRRNI